MTKTLQHVNCEMQVELVSYWQMHEVIDFQVEVLANHKKNILYVRPSIKICLLSTRLSKKVGLLVASFRILGRFFQIFFTWVIGGGTRGNFQCRASYCFG